jgi:hypothetical protein
LITLSILYLETVDASGSGILEKEVGSWRKSMDIYSWISI